MDGFHLIQKFFTRMHCNFCDCHLDAEGIELIRHEKGVYIVNVQCTQCERQMGIALVGLEGSDMLQVDESVAYDLELTDDERERLTLFETIGYDDVIDAHRFFSGLGSDWRKHLPTEMPQWEIAPEWESQAS